MNLATSFSMEISAIYIAFCGILMIVLAALVVRGRLQHQVGIGDGGVKSLNQTIRVHANATEYVPVALLLLVALENTGASTGLVHTMGGVLIVARVLHAVGLSKSIGTSVPRFTGTMGTWLMIVISSVVILAGAL